MSLPAVADDPETLPPPAARRSWTKPGWTPVIVLGVLGLLELGLCFYGAHAQGRRRITTAYSTALAQAIPYLLASALVWRLRTSRTALILVLGFGFGFRCVAVLHTRPYLSTDVYRYVWDGRVQGAGINPYRYPSSDPALAGLRDRAVYAKMNRPDARTIYPPGAEMLFYLVTRLGGGRGVMRWAMLAFEGVAVWATCRLLRDGGQPAQRVLLYAWHPLPVWEFAGSGHVDAALIAAILLALLAVRRARNGVAGAALAAAALIKLFPVILFPALYRRWDWKLPLASAAAVAAAYAIYLGVGWRLVFDFLFHGYAKEEGLSSGERFFGLALVNRATGLGLPSAAFAGFAALVLGGMAAWMFRTPPRDAGSPLRRAAALATVFTALFSPGYAWYFAWLVPFLPFVPRPSLFWLTAASFVLYANWLHPSPDDFFVIGCVLYLPAALLALGESLPFSRRWTQTAEASS